MLSLVGDIVRLHGRGWLCQGRLGWPRRTSRHYGMQFLSDITTISQWYDYNISLRYYLNDMTTIYQWYDCNISIIWLQYLNDITTTISWWYHYNITISCTRTWPRRTSRNYGMQYLNDITKYHDIAISCRWFHHEKFYWWQICFTNCVSVTEYAD